MHDNAKDVKIATNLTSSSIMSDASHFSIVNNELVKKSGIYEIRFFDSFMNQQRKMSVWFRLTNIGNKVQTNKQITDLNVTSAPPNIILWVPISVFFCYTSNGNWQILDDTLL